jgi:hypothetical protein
MAVATPVLALARGLIGLLAFELAPIPIAEANVVAPSTNLVCDDGGQPFFRNGVYRTECTHEGCGLNDEVCYFGDYFERCLDEFGIQTGECTTTTYDCEGVIGCLSLWIDCEGEYICTTPAIVGCKEGVCKED